MVATSAKSPLRPRSPEDVDAVATLGADRGRGTRRVQVHFCERAYRVPTWWFEILPSTAVENGVCPESS